MTKILKPKKILIIGGEGYIGTVLSSYLLKKGYFVKSLDLLLYQNHTCILNNYGNEQYVFFYGDMADEQILTKAIDGVESVVLLAGLVGDPITKKYPEESAAINNRGVKTVIDACNNKGVKRLIFVSTCSNYGLIKTNEKADENHVLNPLSHYAESKVAIEEYILSLQGKVDYHPTILRFATAFGLSPRTRFDLTVNQFTRELFLGRELLVYDAHTWRPYCHTQDFARLIHMVLETLEEKVNFEVFNVGGEVNNYTKQMIMDEILKMVPDGKVKYQKHDSDPRNYRVDFSKVKSVLGFEPQYLVRDGIKELITAMKKHVFDLVDERKNFYGNYEIDYNI